MFSNYVSVQGLTAEQKDKVDKYVDSLRSEQGRTAWDKAVECSKIVNTPKQEEADQEEETCEGCAFFLADVNTERCDGCTWYNKKSTSNIIKECIQLATIVDNCSLEEAIKYYSAEEYEDWDYSNWEAEYDYLLWCADVNKKLSANLLK